ncbi:uncharacterized protein L203_103353 [Cryptococcus depauperatus CBS 7841]|uniref:Uncharacterized protein n=1 Tax=Cryptococcus depauperatus CBS 7841 TaxID=1295531 RepID=A0A1E3I262_9TREE|nr:hypothetical protein L203_05386 [Cryptococcus depauperatus CBS 7841]
MNPSSQHPTQTQAAHAAANSIASLLYSHSERDDVENHGLMEYLQHNEYTHDADRDGTGGLVPLPAHRGSPYRGHSLTRSASPPNPTVPIPASLSRLATNALSTFHSPAVPSLPAPVDHVSIATSVDYGDRGEMGGKRRKQPHERAGWADMDKDVGTGKRRRTRKSDGGIIHPVSASPSQQRAEGNPQPLDGVSGHDMSSLQELSRMVTQTQHVDEPDTQSNVPQSQDGQGPAIDPTLANSVTQESHGKPLADYTMDAKFSRAEQNKRAQQAFRRRREEHMKRLEAESAQLQSVMKQCMDQEMIIKDLLLSQQSDKIRIVALEALIRQQFIDGSNAMLTAEGELNVPESGSSEAVQIEGKSSSDIERALDILALQSREVAKAMLRG